MAGPDDGREQADLTPDAYDVLAEVFCLDHARVIAALHKLHERGLTIGAIGPGDVEEIGRVLTEQVPQYMRVEHIQDDATGMHGLAVEFNALGFLYALAKADLIVLRRPPIRHDYTTLGPGEILATHPADRCAGSPCCIHNPSDHPLRHAQLHWDPADKAMSRECIHGLLHPDPDHLSWLRQIGRFADAQQQALHTCCSARCCVPVESVLSP